MESASNAGQAHGTSSSHISGGIGQATKAAIGVGNTQADTLTQAEILTQADNITQIYLRREDLPSNRIDELLPKATLNLSDHSDEAKLFLSRMEGVIKAELVKAKDEHFVELSMQLADAATYSSQSVGRMFRIAVGDNPRNSETITDLKGLIRLLKDGKSMVLLGIPGSGKSTVLHHLALLMICAYRNGDSALLPFFVRLTDYKLNQEGRTVPIREFLRMEAIKLAGEKSFIARYFEQLTLSSRFCFLLDGLDQMPERRSETIRIRQRKKVEADLRRVDLMLMIARFFGMKKTVARLLGSRQEVTTEAGPTIDPRESEINKLPETLNCVAIASCREHDFLGVPRWQTLSILPMDAEQITDFIRCYARGAEDLIAAQAESSDTTRSLITNPFYLKMLTQAAQRGLQDAIQAQEFKKVLSRRGKLLEYLIGEAVLSSLKRDFPDQSSSSLKQQRDQILAKLGYLAYYMLERNMIGSVPHETLQRILGDDLSQVLQCAEDANLVTVQEGASGIEFNHQLFLESLLALELRKKAAEGGKFEEALQLLSQRGDRWAETIRLLFEMVSESDAEALIEKFVSALGAQDTWDLAARVLADLGLRVAPYVAPLLRAREEMRIIGAVQILGRVRARDCAGDLVALKTVNSWRARRAAVEALTAMALRDEITAFESDRHPAVLRAVFRADLLLEDSPINRIKAELSGSGTVRAEQMAFAVLDLFANLLNRLGQETVLDLLRTMISHKNHEISVLGFLIIGQAPDYFKRVLKQEVLNAALNDDDDFVNIIARRAITRFLDANDIAYLRKIAPDDVKIELFQKQDKLVMRAYFLLLEVREMGSPSEYLEKLCYAPPTEIQLLARKLSSRGDSTALSFLTFLLADKRTAVAAVEALMSLDKVGVAYLLDALNDPSEQIRINVSELLQYCHLPRTYSRRLRSNLRGAKIKFHNAKAPVLQIPNIEYQPGALKLTFLSVAGLVGFSLFAWVGSKFMGSHTTVRFWMGYPFFGGKPLITVNDPSSSWWINQLERLSFRASEVFRDSDFWLARGRLERALGRRFEARESFKRSLQLNPKSEVARLELALMQRSLGNRGLALEIVRQDDRQYIGSGSDLEALEQLLEIEEQENKSDPLERLRILDRLRLWSESRAAALSFFKTDPTNLRANLVLFRSYKGSQELRRALAAALAYDSRAPQEDRIGDLELEDLRWQLRSERYPPDQIGAFGIAVDVGDDARAYEILAALNLLPPHGAPVTDEQIYRVQTLPSDVQPEVVALLRRRNEQHILAAIVQTMPLQRGGKR